MTKCKVISRNPINMVVDFNGKLIQLPTDNGIDAYVDILCKNGIYSTVSNTVQVKTHKKTEKVTKRDERNAGEEAVGVALTVNTDEIENIIV